MDLETIKTWLQAVNMLGTFALGCWLYLEKRSDKTNERVTELAEKIEQIDRDFTALNALSGKALTPDDLGGVHEKINDLAEKVDTLIGGFDEQSKSLRQILNRIIERGMP